MPNPTSHYLELLEQRITLFDSLSNTLTAARAAIIAFDIDALESRVAEQKQLCRQIQAFDGQVRLLEQQCAAHLRRSDGQTRDDSHVKLEDALRRLQQAQANVKKLNDVHQSVLRRSHRTILALLHSLRAFEGTYQETAMLQTAKRAALQEQA